MSLFKTSTHITIVTRFPAGVSESKVLAAVQDAESLWRLSPIVTRVDGVGYGEAQDGALEEQTRLSVHCRRYCVRERIFGIMPNSFTMAQGSTEDGAVCDAVGEMGLTFHVDWRVGTGEFEGEKRVVLRQDCHLRGLRLLLPFVVRPVFANAHRAVHRSLLEQLSP